MESMVALTSALNTALVIETRKQISNALIFNSGYFMLRFQPLVLLTFGESIMLHMK